MRKFNDIAKQTGLARETISRELTKLRHLVTVNHSGITIKDINGNIEIPKQGILFITNNINKSFIRQ